MNRHFTDSRRFIQAKKRTLRMGMGLIRLVLFFSLSFVILYPLLQKMTAAFMSVEDVYDLSVRYVPRNLTVDHFVQVWKQLDLSKAFPLTVEFVLIATLLQTFIATVVGYGLARFRFRLNRVFFVLALLGLVIPPDLLLVPLYSQFRYFDPLGLCTAFTGGPVSLINSQWPFLILAITGTGYRGGLYILLMNQFFRGMPRELEEAAYIDGRGAGVYLFPRDAARRGHHDGDGFAVCGRMDVAGHPFYSHPYARLPGSDKPAPAPAVYEQRQRHGPGDDAGSDDQRGTPYFDSTLIGAVYVYPAILCTKCGKERISGIKHPAENRHTAERRKRMKRFSRGISYAAAAALLLSLAAGCGGKPKTPGTSQTQTSAASSQEAAQTTYGEAESSYPQESGVTNGQGTTNQPGKSTGKKPTQKTTNATKGTTSASSSQMGVINKSDTDVQSDKTKAEKAKLNFGGQTVTIAYTWVPSKKGENASVDRWYGAHGPRWRRNITSRLWRSRAAPITMKT